MKAPILICIMTCSLGELDFTLVQHAQATRTLAPAVARSRTEKFCPGGFNVGFNEREASGETSALVGEVWQRFAGKWATWYSSD